MNKSKAKDSEINATKLCLGKILKKILVDQMKATHLYGDMYDFSVDYDSIDVDGVLDIYKYLMKRHDIK